MSGYLLLGQKLLEEGNKFAQGFNFGPDEESILTVAQVAQAVVEKYGKGTIEVHKKDNLHEANLLMLNIEKAQKVLGWTPSYSIDKAIEETVLWYKHFYLKNTDMYEYTLNQIKEFERAINREAAIK